MKADYISTKGDIYPSPRQCRCGSYARVRYKIPVHWVECGNKKCPYKLHSGYHTDMTGVFDPAARDRAITDWNRIVTGK